jgi:hypothetical protein
LDDHEYFPMDLRGGLLRWFSDQGVGPQMIWGGFAQRNGYGTVEDYVRRCDARFGEGAEAACRAQMDEYWQRLATQTPAAQGARPESLLKVKLSSAHRLVLHAMADVDFAQVLEVASALVVNELAFADIGMPGYDYVGTVTEHVNGVLERRAIPYRLDRDLRCRFEGDQSTRELAVTPALAVLDDPRLAGARGEFEDALAKLRRAQPKDLEDAIEESRKAVESTMKVLLAAHGHALPPGRQTTKPLHDALIAAGVVEAETDDLVRAAARIANTWGSHGAGHAPRVVPADLAAAAVSAAAAAITYLAARLP